MQTLGKRHLSLKYSQYWQGKQQTLQQHTARQLSSSSESVKHTTSLWKGRIDLKWAEGIQPDHSKRTEVSHVSAEPAGLFAVCRLQPSQFFNSRAGGSFQQASGKPWC